MDVATLASLVVGMQSQSTQLDVQAQLARKQQESEASVLTLLDAAGVSSSGTSAGEANPRGTGNRVNQVA